MDEQSCEFLEACPIFQYFRRTAKRVYMDMYCLDDYNTCKRFQLRMAGKSVPVNLLPYGGTLWDERKRI